MVEDNSTNMKCTKTILSRQGHEVVSSLNGIECLKALETDSFDLILKVGFDGYLSKPLEVKQLILEMKRVISDCQT